LGIEVELEIVDRESRELRSGATEVLAAIGQGHPGGVHPKAKHELMESTVEILTGGFAPPSTTPAATSPPRSPRSARRPTPVGWS
jgi:gamma-glutamyl:cysteine ligase YbdK (ATP-grasp superfamily)